MSRAQEKAELLKEALGRASTQVWEQPYADPAPFYTELLAAAKSKADRDALLGAVRRHLGTLSEQFVADVINHYDSLEEGANISAGFERVEAAVNESRRSDDAAKDFTPEEIDAKRLLEKVPRESVERELKRLNTMLSQSTSETKVLLDRLRALENERRGKQHVFDALSNNFQQALDKSDGWRNSEQLRWSDSQQKNTQ